MSNSDVSPNENGFVRSDVSPNADVCIGCGTTLCQLDKALHRKLINRGAETFMCKRCLAEYFRTTEAHLDELAEYYRKEGCTLFD